jgi:hypothetical protein
LLVIGDDVGAAGVAAPEAGSIRGAVGARGTTAGGVAPVGGTVVGAGGISLSGMTKPHLRHFIRTERPTTLSSAI